jgi:CRP-like cAMP-binding protein
LNSDSSSDESATLTERKKKFALKIPVQNWHAQELWSRAFMKLRSIYLLNKIRDDINTYGTNSHLFDVYGNYRKNLSEIMENKKKNLSETNEVIVHRKRIFYPNETFSRYWNTLLFFLLMYVAFVMPWVMAFSDFYDIGIWTALEVAVDLCFLLDILINLNTAFKDQNGKLVSDRREIFMNYLKGFLFADIFSVFPLYLISESTVGRMNILVRLLRLFRLARVLKVIQKFEVIKRFKSNWMMVALSRNLRSYGGIGRLTGLLFFVLSMTHFMACMWYYVARINNFDYNTWVSRFEFQDESNSIIYMRCLYFAVTVLTTVGFGDIYAMTVAEIVLVVFWMMLGMTFYSILVGTLSSVISSLDVKASLVNAKMNEIDKFALDFKVPYKIVKEMKSFIRSEKEYETISEKERISFIEELPMDLKYKIAFEMFEGVASKVKLFQSQDRVFVSDIVPRLELVRFEKNEMIYEKNDFSENIFFVVEGRVNYVIGCNTIIFKTIMTGAYFGEIELVERTARKFTVRAETFCKFLVMSSQCFEYVLKEYPRIGTHIIKHAEKRNRKNKKAIKEIIKNSKMGELDSEDLEEKPKRIKPVKKKFSDAWVFFK